MASPRYALKLSWLRFLLSWPSEPALLAYEMANKIAGMVGEALALLTGAALRWRFSDLPSTCHNKFVIGGVLQRCGCVLQIEGKRNI